MKTQNTKIRIKDIATLAGVSEGTVDRVLHNRGEVSEKVKRLLKNTGGDKLFSQFIGSFFSLEKTLSLYLSDSGSSSCRLLGKC